VSLEIDHVPISQNRVAKMRIVIAMAIDRHASGNKPTREKRLKHCMPCMENAKARGETAIVNPAESKGTELGDEGRGRSLIP
jgi:hypothetical protein